MREVEIEGVGLEGALGADEQEGLVGEEGEVFDAVSDGEGDLQNGISK